jgi:polyribonucleotide nucleotidyltransferase
MGDVFTVKYIGDDPQTRTEKVSRKALLEKPDVYVARPPRENNDRGGRDNRGGSRDNRGRDNRRDDRRPREDRKED